jgi:hypothetical protein
MPLLSRARLDDSEKQKKAPAAPAPKAKKADEPLAAKEPPAADAEAA